MSIWQSEVLPMSLGSFEKTSHWFLNQTNTLRKSNVILRLYFGNLCKLLSAYFDST